MKLTWADELRTRVTAVLEEGDSIGQLHGPATFDIVVVPGSPVWALVEAMNPMPEIADMPVPPPDPLPENRRRKPPERPDYLPPPEIRDKLAT